MIPSNPRFDGNLITLLGTQNAQFEEACALAGDVLMKKYLLQMRDFEIIPINETQIQEETVWLFKLKRLIFDKESNNQEKLLNVYSALNAYGGSIVLLLISDGSQVEVYLGTKIKDTGCGEILEKTIQGNFYGTILENKTAEIESLMERVTQESNGRYLGNVAAITSMAAFRDGHSIQTEDFVQGLEKLVDAMHGKSYKLMIVAEPIAPEMLNKRRSGYEMLYNQLLPFATTEINFGQNESDAVALSLTHGNSEAITESIAKMTSHSHSHGTTESHSSTMSTNLTLGAMGISKGNSKSCSDTYGTTNTETDTTGKTKTNGNTNTVSDSTGITDTHTIGTNIGYIKHLENRYVKTLLERIDTQLARIDECMDMGMWDCAAYVIADDQRDCRMIASTYQALIRGKESGTESAAITVWNDESSKQVADYLRKMSHPQLRLTDAVTITPATVLSGEELTVAAGLPQQSLPGLPVDTYARFGREIVRSRHVFAGNGNHLSLGQIYHMGQKEKNVSAWLDVEALASHTFVTGSTGSGKSNTIYKVLEGLQNKKIPWLVIEPAKGEYKDVFGDDVKVYGTNPYKTPNLLHVNPFSFPDDVHVLEHVDRLAEIFNACWPMYAAMPAILREAMERSYEECGWNLKISKNPGMFPTFNTLLDVLPQVIDSSAYSADTTSDYKGALVTRVRSLTRGIHGLIFSEDTAAKDLFDRNAIVDLSRVGSQETKSLIMGILVLKLQEHRMAADTSPNSALRHITVLEEAHHLLRRTSSEQTQESSNLAGQAVAMLANSIAEMRTYGEGFIIADQSPGLMDMSVVRNTNTKIILRLPDEGDRLLVGKAAGLNDAQIEELAFLERGVAAVYQSDWAEAVLAKIAKFDNPKPLEMPKGGFEWEDEETEAVKKFLNVALEVEQQVFSEKEVERIRKWSRGMNFNEKAQSTVEKVLHGKPLLMAQKALLLCHIAGKKTLSLPKEKVIEQMESILSGRYGVENNGKVVETMRNVLNKKLPEERELDGKRGVIA